MRFHDFDAYLSRIGWRGPLEPTFETLAGVLGAHMAAIPFENLDVLLGRRVRIDLDGLVAKLVVARRGGYCFEQTTLLQAALEHMGFAPQAHAARVVMFVPWTEAPRTHMFLTVPLPEGTFVVDPGFGVLAARAPVPLVEGRVMRCGAEEHVFAREAGDERDRARWILRARRGDAMVDCWVSTLDRELPVDFELGNHYTSTHPASAFVNRLMLRALLPRGRVSAMNRDVTLVEGDTSVTTRLGDRAALRAVLATYFGFDLPEVEGLRLPSDPEWASEPAGLADKERA